MGDRMRLQQVLLNLAGNAIKFTDRGEVEVNVRASPRQPPSEMVASEGSVQLGFAVRDTGIGIPPSGQEHLFQPFAQADCFHGAAFRRHGPRAFHLQRAWWR